MAAWAGDTGDSGRRGRDPGTRTGGRGDTARRNGAALNAGPARGRERKRENLGERRSLRERSWSLGERARLHRVITWYYGQRRGSGRMTATVPRCRAGRGPGSRCAHFPNPRLPALLRFAAALRPELSRARCGPELLCADAYVQAPCKRRASAVRAPRSFSTLYFLQTSTRATSTCFEAQLRRPGGAHPPASGFGGSDLAATVFCGAWSPIPRFPPPRDPAWTSAPRLRGQPTADVRSGRT